jgi:hypothetical protein
MKKYLLFLIVTSFVLGFYGCSDKIIETENFCTEKNIDSINFSTKICIELPVKGKKTVINSINKTLIKEILSLDYDGLMPSKVICKYIAGALGDYDISVIGNHYNENISGLVTFLNKQYLCYRYNSEFYGGGAHGLQNTFYFVFDLKTGKRLTENEVFKPDFQSAFSEIITEILSNSELYPDNETYELAELKLNGNFSFEPDTLIYTFNEYEIAPYSSGKIDVKIPYSKIRHIFNVDLSRLVE